MKNIIKFMFFVCLSVLLIGCEKETKVYDGEESLYFSIQSVSAGESWRPKSEWGYDPISLVEFIKIAEHSTTVKLKVMTTGNIKDYDRSFRITVLPDTSTALEGLNYEPLDKEYAIKAGEYFTEIPIIVHRTDNIQNESKDIVLELQPNEHFSLSIKEWEKLPNALESIVLKGDFKAYQHKVSISDFMTQPSQWLGRIDNGFDAGSFGGFTQKKIRLICEHFNLVHEDFMSAETMPTAFIENIREYMVRLLKGLKEAGTPILEEDGRLMWFSGVNWSSKVGVPWDPNN